MQNKLPNMINRFTAWEGILFAIGILLTTCIPLLVNGHYLPIPDFWGGFLGGLGIGIMIALLIRVTRRKREEQQKL